MGKAFNEENYKMLIEAVDGLKAVHDLLVGFDNAVGGGTFADQAIDDIGRLRTKLERVVDSYRQICGM